MRSSIPYFLLSFLLVVQSSALVVHPVSRQNGDSDDACTPTCLPYDRTYEACSTNACFCTITTEAHLEDCISCHLKLTPDQRTVNVAQGVINDFEDICGAFALPEPKVTFPPGLTPTGPAAGTTRTTAKGTVTTMPKPTPTSAVTPLLTTTTQPTPTTKQTAVGPTTITPSGSPAVSSGSKNGGSPAGIIGVLYAGTLAAVLAALM